MNEPTYDGMTIVHIRHVATGAEYEYECLDEGCARLLAAGDHGGDPEDYEVI